MGLPVCDNGRVKPKAKIYPGTCVVSDMAAIEPTSSTGLLSIRLHPEKLLG
jgi:hypothetical protein